MMFGVLVDYAYKTFDDTTKRYILIQTVFSLGYILVLGILVQCY